MSMIEEKWIKYLFGSMIVLIISVILYMFGMIWVLIPILLFSTLYFATRRIGEVKKNMDPMKVLKMFSDRQSTGKLHTLSFLGTNWDVVDKFFFYGRLVFRGEMAFANPFDPSGRSMMIQPIVLILDPMNNSPGDDNSSLILFYVGYLDMKEIEKICKMGAPAVGVEGVVEKLQEAKKTIGDFEEAKSDVEGV